MLGPFLKSTTVDERKLCQMKMAQKSTLKLS